MSDAVITREQVEGWKAEQARIAEAIAELKAKRAVIFIRLRAAKTLISDDAEVFRKGPKGPALVISALAKLDKPVKPREIKEVMLEMGYSEETWGSNFTYLYTVLRRLDRAGTVLRQEGLYSLAALEGK